MTLDYDDEGLPVDIESTGALASWSTPALRTFLATLQERMKESLQRRRAQYQQIADIAKGRDGNMDAEFKSMLGRLCCNFVAQKIVEGVVEEILRERDS